MIEQQDKPTEDLSEDLSITTMTQVPDTMLYDASKIQVLEGLEPVRKRPGMYIGSTGEAGLHHLVYEVVDNSIDEAMAGYCSRISVRICEDQSVIVEDDGRGIPVDVHEKTGKSALETVMTVLHAGGKFGEGGYKVSGGLHGVGVSVVNALSEWCEVQVKRNGKKYHQRFERGQPIGSIAIIEENIEGTGTRTHFKPDGEVMEVLTFQPEILAKRFKETSFLNKGIHITFEVERRNLTTDTIEVDTEVFHHEGGIIDFVNHLNEGKDCLYETPIYYEGEKENVVVEIAIQHSTAYSENIQSFVNSINTIHGGTHVTGFRAALTRVVNDYGRRHNIIKENEENMSGEDVREGITAIINVRIPEPQFEGQTKAKLGNTEARSAVEYVSNSALVDYLDAHPTEAKIMITKALEQLPVKPGSWCVENQFLSRPPCRVNWLIAPKEIQPTPSSFWWKGTQLEALPSKVETATFRLFCHCAVRF